MLSCPHCHAKLRLKKPEATSKQRARCPRCNQRFLIRPEPRIENDDDFLSVLDALDQEYGISESDSAATVLPQRIGQPSRSVKHDFPPSRESTETQNTVHAAANAPDRRHVPTTLTIGWQETALAARKTHKDKTCLGERVLLTIFAWVIGILLLGVCFLLLFVPDIFNPRRIPPPSVHAKPGQIKELSNTLSFYLTSGDSIVKFADGGSLIVGASGLVLDAEGRPRTDISVADVSVTLKEERVSWSEPGMIKSAGGYSLRSSCTVTVHDDAASDERRVFIKLPELATAFQQTAVKPHLTSISQVFVKRKAEAESYLRQGMVEVGRITVE